MEGGRRDAGGSQGGAVQPTPRDADTSNGRGGDGLRGVHNGDPERERLRPGVHGGPRGERNGGGGQERPHLGGRAEGATSGAVGGQGGAVHATAARDADKSNGKGGDGKNGDPERERLRPGVRGGPRGGRNGGVGQERPHLGGRAQGATSGAVGGQGGAAHATAPDAEGSNARADGRGAHNGDAEQKRLRPGAHGGLRGGRNGGVAQESPHLGGRSCPLRGSNGNGGDKKLGLGGFGGDQQVQDGNLPATGSTPLQGAGISGGGDLDGAAATSQQSATRTEGLGDGEEQALLPRGTFLCDVVLSWTLKDVLNDNLYKEKVQEIPDVFETTQHFAEVHHQLLLEELRSDFCSSINNPSGTQYCKLGSVQPCDSAFLYFLDIDLDSFDPKNAQCRHIAHDYDICLLTSKPLGDPNFDIVTSSLSIAVGIGKDVFFQKGFRVLVSKSKDFQPQNAKYVSFLANIQHQMEVSNILSFDDERNHAAIQRVIELYDKARQQCTICVPTANDEDILHPGFSEYLFSIMRCPHRSHVEVVWAPMGSMKGCMTHQMKELFNAKQKILICLPNASGIPDTLMDLKEFSDSIVVLNTSKGLENKSVCDEVFLESRSHKLYCFVTQYKGSLKSMSSLLNLSMFYHYKCCFSTVCERCTKKGLLHFSMKAFLVRFNNLIEYIVNCLTFLEKHDVPFCLLEEDKTKVGELLKTLKELESLLCDENLKDEYAAAAFKLMPGADTSSLDSSTYTLAEVLNKKRISSINLMASIINSVQVPNMKNRDDMDRFAIKHSRIVVTTVDCALKLHDMVESDDQFDTLLILGTNQMREVDLLVPFIHPVKNAILIGDPHNLEPSVQSEKLFPKKVLMLKQQSAIHPMISKFPNKHFYNGSIEDGPNVRLPGYNEEFSIKLPVYCFMDVPFGEMKPTRKTYVNSDITYSNRKFSVAVVCMSNDEANAVRYLQRYKEEIQAKVYLHVMSIDNFQDQSFDLIILSMIVEDKTELSHAKEKNVYAVLTNARHYFWMVGEGNTLIGAGDIWKCLVTDATQQKHTDPMKIDELFEAAKYFEKIDKGQCTNYVPSNKFTHLLGQEFTWVGRPYKTKYMLPPVRDQKGQPDTCSFQSISAAVEFLLKLLFADMMPQQEFKWTFIVDNFKQKYEIIMNKKFQSENVSDRGQKRFENALTAFKTLGVLAKNESGSEFREFKISGHAHVDPEMTKEVTKLLEAGSVTVGSFMLSRNFYSLKPGDVYVFDMSKQLFHPKYGCRVSHGVMMIGIGHTQTGLEEKTGKPKYTRHMVMQNSEGNLFGINGIGRVEKDSVLCLYRIEVDDPDAKKPARQGGKL